MDLAVEVFALVEAALGLAVAAFVVADFDFTAAFLVVATLDLAVADFCLAAVVLGLVVPLLDEEALDLDVALLDLVTADFALVVALFDLAVVLLLFEVEDLREDCLLEFDLAELPLFLLLPDAAFWAETPGLRPAELLCEVNPLRALLPVDCLPKAPATFLVDAAPRAP